jgi:hypothetical protein
VGSLEGVGRVIVAVALVHVQHLDVHRHRNCSSATIVHYKLLRDRVARSFKALKRRLMAFCEYVKTRFDFLWNEQMNGG